MSHPAIQAHGKGSQEVGLKVQQPRPMRSWYPMAESQESSSAKCQELHIARLQGQRAQEPSFSNASQGTESAQCLPLPSAVLTSYKGLTLASGNLSYLLWMCWGLLTKRCRAWGWCACSYALAQATLKKHVHTHACPNSSWKCLCAWLPLLVTHSVRLSRSKVPAPLR